MWRRQTFIPCCTRAVSLERRSEGGEASCVPDPNLWTDRVKASGAISPLLWAVDVSFLVASGRSSSLGRSSLFLAGARAEAAGGEFFRGPCEPVVSLRSVMGSALWLIDRRASGPIRSSISLSDCEVGAKSGAGGSCGAIPSARRVDQPFSVSRRLSPSQATSPNSNRSTWSSAANCSGFLVSSADSATRRATSSSSSSSVARLSARFAKAIRTANLFRTMVHQTAVRANRCHCESYLVTHRRVLRYPALLRDGVGAQFVGPWPRSLPRGDVCAWAADIARWLESRRVRSANRPSIAAARPGLRRAPIERCVEYRRSFRCPFCG